MDLMRSRRSSAVAAAALLCALTALVALTSSCGKSAPATNEPLVSADWAPSAKKAAGLTFIARTQGEHLLLATRGGDVDFVPGVNLGSTIPGHSPGELATRRRDYRRWFPQIAALGLRAVRVYTIHKPAFYQELRAYNEAHPHAPIYLIQGVWIPEEAFLATRDLFARPFTTASPRRSTTPWRRCTVTCAGPPAAASPGAHGRRT
ncbi:MAG TPA: hypothetical protein VJ787_11035 [Thermoleophilia bacterium]|nr:hypothetical protein [Thermoleophilia bacterium]